MFYMIKTFMDKEGKRTFRNGRSVDEKKSWVKCGTLRCCEEKEHH